MILEIAIFLGACLILSLLSGGLIKTLVSLAKYLGWREFMIGFFVMAFATSLPNLFVDVSAALRGMPELAFGDIIGGNLVDLTLVMGLAVLFSKKNSCSTKSKTVQTSAIFTAVIAILPLLLILDGRLDRIDGVIMLSGLVVYSLWMFSKKERFTKKYRISKKEQKQLKDPLWLFKNVSKLLLLLVLLIGASFVIVNSATMFATELGVSLSLVGILIVGVGNSFPEAYFSILSARRGEGWMVLGDLMGSVIVCSTMVIGIVALLTPFQIDDFSPFFIARIFTIIAVVLYVIVMKSGKEITKREGILLISIYVAFLLTEIFAKDLI